MAKISTLLLTAVHCVKLMGLFCSPARLGCVSDHASMTLTGLHGLEGLMIVNGFCAKNHHRNHFLRVIDRVSMTLIGLQRPRDLQWFISEQIIFCTDSSNNLVHAYLHSLNEFILEKDICILDTI